MTPSYRTGFLGICLSIVAITVVRQWGIMRQWWRQRKIASWPWARFATESGADDFLKSLRELPPPARYQPGRPEVSALDPYRDAVLGL
jgi:hypothetical protein